MITTYHQNLWRHLGEAQRDLSLLQRQEQLNLIYLISGDVHFAYQTTLNVTNFFRIPTDDIVCTSARDEKRIKTFLRALKSEKAIFQQNLKLLLLDGIEELDDSNIRNLDFLFQLTDRSSDLTSLIVVLIIRNSTSLFSPGLVTSSPDVNIRTSTVDSLSRWKMHFADYMTHPEVNFNGIGLSGRITRYSMQSILDKDHLKEEYLSWFHKKQSHCFTAETAYATNHCTICDLKLGYQEHAGFNCIEMTFSEAILLLISIFWFPMFARNIFHTWKTFFL